MISAVLSRLVILVFGTLYPAYASYKAVRTKNVKEYVKWMMYWIVFALFTCAETFTDVFLSWFPFYYEIKIILVFWLLSPATKGSSILYRKFVHPALCRREQEIDECITKAKEQGYHTVLSLGSKGVNYATNVIMQTAIKGGGGLVQQLRKSYSLSDLSASDDHVDSHSKQEIDEIGNLAADPRVVRRSVSVRGRSPRPNSSPRVDMYFSEVDVNSRTVISGRDNVNLSHIRSSEDISNVYIPENTEDQDILTRTSSVGGTIRNRNKINRNTFTSIKRPGAAEDQITIEEIDDMEDSISIETPLKDIIKYCNDPLFDQYINFLASQNPNFSMESSNISTNYLQFKKIFNIINATDSREIVSDLGSIDCDGKKNKDNDLPIKCSDENTNEKSTVEDVHTEINCSESLLSLEMKNEIEDLKRERKDCDVADVAIISECATMENKTTNYNEGDLLLLRNEVCESVDTVSIESVSTVVRSCLENNEYTVEDNFFIKQSNSIDNVITPDSLSENEDNEVEFNTPSGSPTLQNKFNKSPKHKKRQAPLPPTIAPDDPMKASETKSVNIFSEKDENDVDLDTENKCVHVSHDENRDECNDDTSLHEVEDNAKSKTKNIKQKQGLSKILHLPSKLFAWNKSNNSLHEESLENQSNDLNSSCSSISSDSKLIANSKQISASLASINSTLEHFDDSINDKNKDLKIFPNLTEKDLEKKDKNTNLEMYTPSKSTEV